MSIRIHRWYRRYSQLDRGAGKMLFEALAWTGYFRIALWTRPFKKLVASLEHRREGGTSPPLDEQSLSSARSVGWAVGAVSRNAPWRSTCLIQVLAAQRMLKSRGISGAFHLGATLEERNKLNAHAWLKCGGEVITGENGHQRFTIVSSFLW